VTYEWDPAKAKANARKHHVSFEEGASIFLDHAVEDRFITIGRSARQRVLFVSHAEREDRIRIISARRATRREGLDEATQ